MAEAEAEAATNTTAAEEEAAGETAWSPGFHRRLGYFPAVQHLMQV